MPSARYTREIPYRYRLESSQCRDCNKIFYPPRVKCNRCGSIRMKSIRLSPYGKVLTYTVIRVAPTNFIDEQPYAIGVIELENGGRMMAQIVDIKLSDLKIGMPVRLEFRRITAEGEAGIVCYGHKAVPI